MNPGALNQPQKNLGASDGTKTTANIYDHKTRKPGNQSKGGKSRGKVGKKPKQTFSPVSSQLQEYGPDDIVTMKSKDRKNEYNRRD